MNLSGHLKMLKDFWPFVHTHCTLLHSSQTNMSNLIKINSVRWPKNLIFGKNNIPQALIFGHILHKFWRSNWLLRLEFSRGDYYAIFGHINKLQAAVYVGHDLDLTNNNEKINVWIQIYQKSLFKSTIGCFKILKNVLEITKMDSTESIIHDSNGL